APRSGLDQPASEGECRHRTGSLTRLIRFDRFRTVTVFAAILVMVGLVVTAAVHNLAPVVPLARGLWPYAGGITVVWFAGVILVRRRKSSRVEPDDPLSSGTSQGPARVP
ncbi:hypothetical protein, partial [Nocardia sp. NPDC046763]|uniref:hypothetical protein n=1 Tax=Nocardia sp. NPDC046763 TaxID=3155256 RepID=UPI0034007A06